jgi:hypothetical protein
MGSKTKEKLQPTYLLNFTYLFDSHLIRSQKNGDEYILHKKAFSAEL